jgi:hypothetical protein
VGLVIPPTVVIEQQLEAQMAAWGIKFLNLASTTPDQIPEAIRRLQPSIILGRIELLDDREVQSALLTTKLTYVSLDEIQVSAVQCSAMQWDAELCNAGG